MRHVSRSSKRLSYWELSATPTSALLPSNHTRQLRRVPYVQSPIYSGTRRSLAAAAASEEQLGFDTEEFVHQLEQEEEEQRQQEASPWGASRYMLSGGMLDYYEVLQVDDDASLQEVKRAYRSLAKECHPDYLGDRGHNLCIVLNEAFEVLSDPQLRAEYNGRLDQALKDESDSYTGRSLSKWIPTARPHMARNADPAERRAVFVDEFTCIGCKQCVWCASATFRIEPTHGRSRVFAQWLDPEDSLQTAIESCPVSCIHWVDREDLAALEYVTQRKVTQRVNVANMMSGQGGNTDAFSATDTFLKARRRRAEAAEEMRRSRSYSPAQEAARRSATEDLRRQHLGWFAQFSDFFSGATPQQPSSGTGRGDDPEVQQVGQRKRTVRWSVTEREAAAAAAAEAASRSRSVFSVPPELGSGEHQDETAR